jgi:riboflavin synthase
LFSVDTFHYAGHGAFGGVDGVECRLSLAGGELGVVDILAARVAPRRVVLSACESGRTVVDVMHETLRRSSLAEVSAGGRVNLELPLRAQDRLGGHVVQGHVDGLGSVVAVEEDGFARVVTIAAPADLLRYVVEKGSIAVDGVSLTVASVTPDTFSVSLIPETLERTNLGAAAPGTPVNLEVDVLAKYVEKLVTVA